MKHEKSRIVFLKKDAILNEYPIYYYISTPNYICCEPESANATHSYDFAEIDLIIYGSGLHLIQDQSLPCKAGDLFIIPPNIPLEYFNSSCAEDITVKGLFFNPSELFEGDISDIRTQRYCFGFFDDNTAVAYTLLDYKTQEEIDALYGSIQRELLENGMKPVADRTDAAASVSFIDLSVEAECFDATLSFSDDEVPTVKCQLITDMDEAEALEIPLIGSGRTSKSFITIYHSYGK